MTEIALIVSCMLIPIMSIVFFVIGYNVNAPRKLLFRRRKRRKPKKTEYERKMEQIDNVSLKGE